MVTVKRMRGSEAAGNGTVNNLERLQSGRWGWV